MRLPSSTAAWSVNYDDPFGLCYHGEGAAAQANRTQSNVAACVHEPGVEGPGLMDPLFLVGGLEAKEGEAAAEGIKVAAEDLEHVVESHTASGALNLNKSIFAEGEDLLKLVRGGEATKAMKQSFGNNFQRIIDAGRHVGVDRATGQSTSIYTIITDAANNLKTMFPGTP